MAFEEEAMLVIFGGFFVCENRQREKGLRFCLCVLVYVCVYIYIYIYICVGVIERSEWGVLEKDNDNDNNI